jgi:transcriptional regulator with XRE-family HTH domain
MDLEFQYPCRSKAFHSARVFYSELVTVSEAILRLRKKLGTSPEHFAPRLGVSARTVYRLEKGQQPTTHALVRLAEMAHEAGMQQIALLFEATRLTNLGARAEKTSGTKRVRRVSLSDLKHWSDSLNRAAHTIEDTLAEDNLIAHKTPAHIFVSHSLRDAGWVMCLIRRELEVVIAEAFSSASLQQDPDIGKGRAERPEVDGPNAKAPLERRANVHAKISE